MKKNQNMLVWLSKNGFCPAFPSTGYYEAGKRQSLIRPSPAVVVLSMWPSNRKSDEEKSKHIYWFGSAKWFWPSIF